jgi:hypothetical protein
VTEKVHKLIWTLGVNGHVRQQFVFDLDQYLEYLIGVHSLFQPRNVSTRVANNGITY